MTDFFSHSSQIEPNFGWNSSEFYSNFNNRRNAIVSLPPTMAQKANYFDTKYSKIDNQKGIFNEFQTFATDPNSTDYSAINKRRRAYGDAFCSDAPKRKIRITEEKMAARLRNFHISNDESRINPDWFFVRRPAESLADIDCRLSSDEDDEQTSSNETTDINEPKLEMSKGIEDFLKTKRDERLRQPLYVQPSPCTDLVLWKPREGFIRELSRADDDSEPTVEPQVTFPTTPVDETPDTYFGKRRQRRRFGRGPFIEDVSTTQDTTDDGFSMEVDS